MWTLSGFIEIAWDKKRYLCRLEKFVLPPAKTSRFVRHTWWSYPALFRSRNVPISGPGYWVSRRPLDGAIETVSRRGGQGGSEGIGRSSSSNSTQTTARPMARRARQPTLKAGRTAMPAPGSARHAGLRAKAAGGLAGRRSAR